MSDTHVLTALYADHSAAERAAERLRATGIAEPSIEMHSAEEGDVVPGQRPVGDGLFGALSSLMVPESDLRGYERGLGRGGTVLIASAVPHERVAEAERALEEDAIEIDDEGVTPAPEDPRRSRHYQAR